MRGAVEAVEADETRWRSAVTRALRPGRVLDPEGQRLVELVAGARRIPEVLLLHPSRCAANVAEARQLAMYLMHVVLSRTYAEVGAFFGRDRTTVSHACSHIEDRRDQPRFDAEVCGLEASLRAMTGSSVEARNAER